MVCRLVVVCSSLLVLYCVSCCFLKYTATPEIYSYGHTLSLHDALPISLTELMEAAERMQAGEVLPPDLAEALLRGTSIGGARPKATISEQGRSWIARSEEHTSELQSLMRISYAVFCLKKKIKIICFHKKTNMN